MKRFLIFLLFFLIFTSLSAENTQKYDEKSFDALFKAVSKHYSKEELRKIVEESLQPDELTEKNLAFIYSPLSIRKQAEDHTNYIDKLINDETVKNGVDFFNKYKELQSSNIAQPFYLEKELARQVKYWHSTNQQFKLPVLTMDNFFNEENVKSHLLKDTYIKKNPSIVTYYLIDYLISILEEKAFDKILMEGITTYQNEQYQIGLVGPIIDRDLIYYLINEDIEEKLNYFFIKL